MTYGNEHTHFDGVTKSSCDFFIYALLGIWYLTYVGSYHSSLCLNWREIFLRHVLLAFLGMCMVMEVGASSIAWCFSLDCSTCNKKIENFSWQSTSHTDCLFLCRLPELGHVVHVIGVKANRIRCHWKDTLLRIIFTPCWGHTEPCVDC